MIKQAMRLYLTSKCSSLDRRDAIKRVSKLFRCPKERTKEIYEEWRKDYINNNINMI